jgi:hypothetical protein
VPGGVKHSRGIPPAATAAAAALKRRQLAERIASGKKWCNRGAHYLSLDDENFGRATAPDGYRSWCKPCVNADAREKAALARAAAKAAAAEQARRDALAERDAAERARPALRAVRLVREWVERDRAEVEAWRLWRRGLRG